MCIQRAASKLFEDAHREYLMPQQVGVGVRGGIGILIFGLRLMMELYPDFVFVSLDKKNAHNEFDRVGQERTRIGTRVERPTRATV